MFRTISTIIGKDGYGNETHLTFPMEARLVEDKYECCTNGIRRFHYVLETVRDEKGVAAIYKTVPKQMTLAAIEEIFKHKVILINEQPEPKDRIFMITEVRITDGKGMIRGNYVDHKEKGSFKMVGDDVPFFGSFSLSDFNRIYTSTYTLEEKTGVAARYSMMLTSEHADFYPEEVKMTKEEIEKKLGYSIALEETK